MFKLKCITSGHIFKYFGDENLEFAPKQNPRWNKGMMDVCNCTRCGKEKYLPVKWKAIPP